MEYVADFETTSVRVYKEVTEKVNGEKKKVKKLDQEKSSAFVCAWAIIPVEKDPAPEYITRGRTVTSFLAYCEAIYNEEKKETTGRRRPHVSVYTHNLKFDGDFILYEILKNGTAELVNEVRENVLYNFTIRYPSGAEITFYDSMKIFPMKAEKVGKLYGIKKLSGDWDYNKYRDENTEITPEEWAYVDHDVMIISRALADYRARGYHENTQASIAYSERLRRTYPRFNKLIAKRMKTKDFDRFREAFPYDIMPLPFELHRHVLLGYFGGISWLNPKYACQDIINAHSYDVNSMYPDKMANYPLPVGQPIIINDPTPEDADRMLRAYSCVMADFEDLTLVLKSPRHFPFLMFPTNDKTSVRMQGKIIACKNEFAVLSGYDYKIMTSEYNIKSMKITKIYLFNSKKGQYADFIHFFMDQKTAADKVRNDPEATPEEKQDAEVKRSIAKVMMNSSYGKDGTKLLRQCNETFYSPSEDRLEQKLNSEIALPEYYLPSAIMICAAARFQLFSAARLVRDDFIYSDTDSVKVTDRGNEILQASPDFDIDPYRLGSWGYEGRYDTARFVRQKTYSYTQDGERHYVVCGAPESIKKQMKIDEFKPGMIITLDELHENGQEGRLLPVRVPGGVILEETGFKISEVDNWDEYNGRNMPIDYRLFCDIIARKNAE